MASSSVITRFEGDEGKRRLQNLLERQIIAGGDPTIAADLAEVATCHEISPGDVLIVGGAADNDLFLILQGAFRIIVNGREVAVRKPGHHVGEMAIIDSSAARSASVVASEPGVVAKITEEDFVQLLENHPRIWRSLAIELCQRLREREKFHREPNQKPIIFIGSSKECLDIAEAVRNAIPGTSAAASIWSEDVFTASGLTLESLEAQLVTADFAVLIVGADDEVTSRGTTNKAPRDNVVFELGLFMGALSRYRTFIFAPKGVPLKYPTDLEGFTRIQYDPSAADPASAVELAVEEFMELVASRGPK